MGNLGPYRLSLDRIVSATMRGVADLVRSGYDPSDRAGSAARLAPVLVALVRAQRSSAYALAADLLTSEADAQGVRTPYVPSASGYPDASVRTILRESLRGTRDEAAAAIGPQLAQHVEAAARQTIVRAVEDGRTPAHPDDTAHAEATAIPSLVLQDATPAGQDAGGLHGEGRRPLSWARVLTGAENCGFCVMLASRGPVYSSARDAGRLSASAAFRTADAIGYVNSYHPGCDCVVVPVYSYAQWPGRDSWRKLDKFYQDTITHAEWTDAAGKVHHGITYNNGPSNADGNQVLNALNRELERMAREGKTLPIADLRAAA